MAECICRSPEKMEEDKTMKLDRRLGDCYVEVRMDVSYETAKLAVNMLNYYLKCNDAMRLAETDDEGVKQYVLIRQCDGDMCSSGQDNNA